MIKSFGEWENLNEQKKLDESTALSALKRFSEKDLRALKSSRFAEKLFPYCLFISYLQKTLEKTSASIKCVNDESLHGSSLTVILNYYDEKYQREYGVSADIRFCIDAEKQTVYLLCIAESGDVKRRYDTESEILTEIERIFPHESEILKGCLLGKYKTTDELTIKFKAKVTSRKLKL